MGCCLRWLFLICGCVIFCARETTSVRYPDVAKNSGPYSSHFTAVARGRTNLALENVALGEGDPPSHSQLSWLEQASDDAGNLYSSGLIPSPTNTGESRGRRRWSFGRAKSAVSRTVRSWFDGFQKRLRRWRRRLAGVSPFKEAELGDQIILAMLTMFNRELAAARHPGPNTADEEYAIGQTFWPEGVTRNFQSELSGRPLALVRGPAIGKGEKSVVAFAKNVATLEGWAVKIFVLPGSAASAEDVEAVRRQGLLFKRFFLRSTPQKVQDRLRFMVASDMLTLPNESPSLTSELIRRSHTVLNRFLLMPPAVTDALTLLKTLFVDRTMSESEVVMMARLQMTAHMIRQAAHLNSHKFVHGRLRPEKFLVMADGRLMLSDFSYLRRQDLRGPIDPSDPYNPPEFGDLTESVYTASVDAWRLGLTLFQVWCLRLPFNLITPTVDFSPRNRARRAPRVFTEVSLDFTGCVQMPEYVQELVSKFLNFLEKDRLLGIEAVHEAAFKQVQKEIEVRLK